MQDDPRVALIGAGYWGKNLLRNFYELGVLVAVAEPDETRRQELAQRYPGLEWVGRGEELMGREDIDAVAIATPAETHAAMVAMALAKGKHVFVEKPLCLDVDEGKELVRRAEAAGLVLMVGHILQYHPAVERLKAMVDGGQLGQLRYIYSNRLNLGRFRQEENVIWSFAPHDISVILWLTGEIPEQVTSFGGSYLQPAVADVTLSTLSFSSGVKAHIFVSWLHPFKEQKLVVVGSEAMAVFNDTDPERKLLVYSHKVRWRQRVPVPEKVEPVVVEVEKAEPLRRECEHFIECVRTGLTPRTDGHEALGVLIVLDSCQRSLEMGGGVVRMGQGELGEGGQRPYMVHPTAIVDEGCSIGEGTRIWHFSHILSGTRIGRGCTLGQNVMVGPRVFVGDGVKIQNNVSVYEGVRLEDYVFCGPSVVFTNVYNPRSEIPRMHELRHTVVRRGATLGANSTIVCGVTIGEYAFVAAGAVVTRDVPDYALVAGNPAVVKGWMCRCGVRVHLEEDARGVCEACGRAYELVDGRLRPVED